MILPDKVKIGAFTYEVKIQEKIFHNSVECYGVCDKEELVIYISEASNANPQVLRDTFFHECLHGIEQAYGIDLTEDQVSRISTAFIGLLSDNGFLKEELTLKPKRTKKRTKRS